jgi:hypothetical protein
MEASGLAALYDVWDFYVDANADGLPDDMTSDGIGDTYTVCELSLFPPAIAQLPWNYTIEITRIAGGTTTAQLLTPPDLANDPLSLTSYDESVVIGFTPAVPSFTLNDPGEPIAGHVYTNPRQLRESNRLVMEAPMHPLGGPDIDLGTPGRAYCPIELLLGDPSAFNVELAKGDTMTVKARKATPPVHAFASEPFLIGHVFVNGHEQAVSGTSSSSDTPGDGIEFSFTVR